MAVSLDLNSSKKHSACSRLSPYSQQYHYHHLLLQLLLLLVTLSLSPTAAAPPRDLLKPQPLQQMQIDPRLMQTPQLLGILAGTAVFCATIAVVLYLLYASGTLGNAWREIVADAQRGLKGKGQGQGQGQTQTQIQTQTDATRISSPFTAQPELYDYLVTAKATLSSKLDVGVITGKKVTLRMINSTASSNDILWLFEGSNGSAQYHESAYDLARVWGWADVNVSPTDNGVITNNKPWESKAAFSQWIQKLENDGVVHIVVEENEYKKPIGLISLSNHSVRNLSLNIEYTWITPAFQGQQRAHEAFFLLLDFFFRQGYRRITAEVDERNIIARKFLLRCGFQFETVLRKHKVVQNRNSNTALHVLLNSEWQELLPKFKQFQVETKIKAKDY